MRTTALILFTFLVALAACDADVYEPKMEALDAGPAPSGAGHDYIALTVHLRAFNQAGQEVSACDLRVTDRDFGDLEQIKCWDLDDEFRQCFDGVEKCEQVQTLATSNYGIRIPLPLPTTGRGRMNPHVLFVLDRDGNRVGAYDHLYFLSPPDVEPTPWRFFSVTR